jgi:hypothetical protein
MRTDLARRGTSISTGPTSVITFSFGHRFASSHRYDQLGRSRHNQDAPTFQPQERFLHLFGETDKQSTRADQVHPLSPSTVNELARVTLIKNRPSGRFHAFLPAATSVGRVFRRYGLHVCLVVGGVGAGWWCAGWVSEAVCRCGVRP